MRLSPKEDHPEFRFLCHLCPVLAEEEGTPNSACVQVVRRRFSLGPHQHTFAWVSSKPIPEIWLYLQLPQFLSLVCHQDELFHIQKSSYLSIHYLLEAHPICYHIFQAESVVICCFLLLVLHPYFFESMLLPKVLFLSTYFIIRYRFEWSYWNIRFLSLVVWPLFHT